MKDAVLLVSRSGMGSADEKLQFILISQYFELLLRGGNLPSAICFPTDGLQRVCEGTPVIEQLQKMESKNVRLSSCSTCLNYFDLQEMVRVGIVGGMGDILEAQILAVKVISI